VRNKNSNKGIGQRKKLLYPDKFDGSSHLNLFLTSVETCASYNDWDDRDKLVHVKLKLNGNAANILDDGFPDNASYSDLVMKLERRFDTKDQAELYRTQLKS